MSQRSLGDWLAYLEQLHPSAIDMGLERSRQVAERLGLGKLAPRVVT
ncbi:MAG TPA: bifunctional tetrahydrofolate synthase/dihydrofolate synthase, partial [Pseudomonas sp.]|nr:bifunctional tetrahydrofolate synthase/dihydrofolate synthase [Pseudomonas sp.]